MWFGFIGKYTKEFHSGFTTLRLLSIIIKLGMRTIQLDYKFKKKQLKQNKEWST